MQVTTKSGNTYTYDVSTNEITCGDVICNMHRMHFKKLDRIIALPNLDTITIGITDKCNLRCSYCCYSGEYRNTRAHGSKSLNFDELDAILEFAAATIDKRPLIFSFYGGECLLEIENIKKFVNLARAQFSDEVAFEISTNGILLSEEIIEWCGLNKVKLFISIDGTKPYHDKCRRDVNGNSSYDRVYRAIKYLFIHHKQYFISHVEFMMTLSDLMDVKQISEEWQMDEILSVKPPLRISTVAPNYSKGVDKIDLKHRMSELYTLIEYYEDHPDYGVLRVFFESWLAEWIKRPIFKIVCPQEVPTCIPNNRKIYIDSSGQIGICEKIPDTFRIGNIYSGLDWDRVNLTAVELEKVITRRCPTCPVARVCDVCPITLDLSEDEMDIFCHNQRIEQKVKFLMFCELAERGLIC